jgi:hypothetical protein
MSLTPFAGLVPTSLECVINQRVETIESSTIQAAVFEIFDDIQNGKYDGRSHQELKEERTASGGGIRLRTDELVFLMLKENRLKTEDDLKCLSQNLSKGYRRVEKKTFIKSPSEISRCGYCNDPATLKCNQCKKVFYCDGEHQRMHWAQHKEMCKTKACCVKKSVK